MSTGSIPIYFLAVDNISFIKNEAFINYRDDELMSFFTSSGLTKLLLNNKAESNLNAILGIIRTSFVIFLLVVGAIFFSQDANDLVVTPIENMLAKV